jgi:two-component system, OmpR family, alkaline phosphatase synthesis response regulator PhoP
VPSAILVSERRRTYSRIQRGSLQKVLVVGVGENAEQAARELRDAGYQVETCGAGDASALLRRRPSPVALVVDLTAGPDQSPPSGLFADDNSRKPTLAILPEGRFPTDGTGLGFDDFVLYPFRSGELTARLRRLAGQPEIDSPDIQRHGSLVIDLASYRVSVGGSPVELTFKEYELLRFMATQPDRVFTREALLDKVWGYDFYGGARTVDVHIRRLRSKLEIGGHTFIETVRSVGYRFHASS